MIWLNEELTRWIGLDGDVMRRVFAIDGEIYREPPGARRRTLRFEHAGIGYFLKLHWGAGWREIFKNLLALKRPVLGARNEWQAIQALDALGVETMRLAGYGEQGRNPARRRSFVITRELENTVSLEDYCADWYRHPPAPPVKWALIRRVAEMTAVLHDHGLNHRDLYICHFLLRRPWRGPGDPLHLHLIDLHRMQQRSRVPRRWRIKDLAALYYSALHIGLTRRDLYRFARWYRGAPLERLSRTEGRLWRAVEQRALRLQARDPETPVGEDDG